MGRKPIITGHTNPVGGDSTNEHSVRRREREQSLKQWLRDLEKALDRDRSRRLYIKKKEESGDYSEDKAALKRVEGRSKLLDDSRMILDAVPSAQRNFVWQEKDLWEAEERKLV
jgi:hypothetical protein